MFNAQFQTAPSNLPGSERGFNSVEQVFAKIIAGLSNLQPENKTLKDKIKTLQSKNESHAKFCLKQTIEFGKNEDYEKSVEFAKQGLTCEHSNPLVKGAFYCGLADALVNLGKYQEALVATEDGLAQEQLNNTLKAALYNIRSTALLELGKFQEAEVALKDGLALEHSTNTVKIALHYLLTNTLYALGKRKEAQTTARAGIDLEPSNRLVTDIFTNLLKSIQEGSKLHDANALLELQQAGTKRGNSLDERPSKRQKG